MYVCECQNVLLFLYQMLLFFFPIYSNIFLFFPAIQIRDSLVFQKWLLVEVSPTILILYRHPANYGCRFFLKIIFPFFSNWIFLFILSVTFSLFVLFCLFFFLIILFHFSGPLSRMCIFFSKLNLGKKLIYSFTCYHDYYFIVTVIVVML